MEYNTLNHYFTNIRAVNPTQKLDQRINLWIKDGIIRHCSKSECEIDKETIIINGDNLIVSPGFFDMHVHFRDPGFEYKETLETGAEAALNGCFTGVLIMPNTEPPIDNAVVVEYIKQKTKDFMTDIHIAAALTERREGEHLTQMLELNDAGVLMFTDDGNAVQSSEVMRTIFDYAATRDLLVSQHCEDITLTKNFAMNEGALSDKLGVKGYPYIAEEIIIARDIMLAEYCGRRRYHVSHVSTNGAVRIVREAKSRGLRVTCEVTPHHFSLTDKNLETFNTNFKMNPPLRRQRDLDAIYEGLADGTIDCIATDHAPHALHEKEVEFEFAPHGIIGLETALGLAMTNLVNKGIININQLIEKMSINPRKILNLTQPLISKNERANLSIFEPDLEWVVDKNLFKSKSQNTPFDGFRLKGKPKYTINNDTIYYCNL